MIASTRRIVGVAGFAALAGALLGCGGEAKTSAADFAAAICEATQAAQEKYREIDVALGGTTPGTEEYREAVIEFLSSAADIASSYADINADSVVDGDDAEAFQEHFAEEMTYTRERIAEYIDGLREAEAPVVDLDEVLDDVSMAVDYGATETGAAVRSEMRNCDLG